MKKILLIDNKLSIQTDIASDLRNIGYEIDVANDGETGIKKALSSYYSLFVVDWLLPKKSGIEVVKEIRKHHLKQPIIMLSSKLDDNEIIEGLKAGCDDCMRKPLQKKDLLMRIKIHLYKLFLETEDRKIGDFYINFHRHEISIGNQLIEMTKTEFEVLTYFLNHSDIVLSRDQLLRDVWGFEYDGDTRIVDVVVFRLRNKIVTNSFKIKSIRGIGYMLEINEKI